MSLKTLFIVYDNGSYDNTFPMGVGSLAAILKRDGHDITIWNQDVHHWPDDYLREYLDENKFDVLIFSLIGGYYQYSKMKSLSKAINSSKKSSILRYGRLWPHTRARIFFKKIRL